MTYIFQPDRHLLVEQIKKNSHYIKGKVLDVGAGHYSRYEKFFKAEKYIKMDINHSEHVDIVGSVDNIPMEDNSVDSIVCTQVFEHIRYIDKSASELYRVLRKGGHVLLTVPQLNELHEEPHDYFRYTKYGLKSVFENAGFSIVEMDQRGSFFSSTAQMIIRFLSDYFNLYNRKILGKILGKFIYLFGLLSIKLDSLVKHSANKKHAIGWCCVLKK
jgi:SAM-dependent methyltransferase